MMRESRILLSVTALALALLAGVVPLHSAQIKREDPVETQMRSIAQNLRCPVCQGQSVYDSNSDLARQMKQTIRDRITAGDTPSQIFDFFVARYGDYVLMAPPQRGLHWGLWLGPFALLLMGCGLLVWRISRSRQEAAAGSGNGSYEDMERLEL
jgi:cytochrome c-type biogenesis protein CcmH